MSIEEFKNLYTKQPQDLLVIAFANELGFTIIRDYPLGTELYRDGMKMFIKMAVLEKGLYYSVDITKPKKEEGENEHYLIVEAEQYNWKVTGFYSDDDPFKFDENSKKIIHTVSGRTFTLNEFVEILVANHMTDKLFLKRKLNMCAEKVLQFLFWLDNRHYEKVTVAIDLYHFRRDKKPLPNEEVKADPFFKYFMIAKNMIFFVLILMLLLAVIFAGINYKYSIQRFWIYGEFTISNPIVLLPILITFFLSEKASFGLHNKIIKFFSEKSNSSQANFISRLHEYQSQNKFSLKLPRE